MIPMNRTPEISIEKEMKKSYLDYAMSVIIGRALPDVRDGLKPVHRRVLYAMGELKNDFNKPYKKSARIVGDVIGKYHPHGDTAVYDTIVRMAQDFSMRYPLVDGQGNFGSIDGDPPAAMRYTEIRMQRLAHEILADLEKETVDFAPNYDESLVEPCVMPSKIPNLLVNGSAGIAVGMTTNIPPHNLSEVTDALIALIDNPGISVRGSDGACARPRLSHRRHHLRPGWNSRSLHDRPGHHPGTRPGDGREGQAKPDRNHRHHGAAVSGQQGQADRKNRRTAPGQAARWRQVRPGRIRPGRDADRARDEERRDGARDHQPALQTHPDGDQLRDHLSRHRQQPAGAADAQGDPGVFRPPPQRRSSSGAPVSTWPRPRPAPTFWKA